MMKFAASSAHPYILFMYLIPYCQPIRLMEFELVTVWAKTKFYTLMLIPTACRTTNLQGLIMHTIKTLSETSLNQIL